MEEANVRAPRPMTADILSLEDCPVKPQGYCIDLDFPAHLLCTWRRTGRKKRLVAVFEKLLLSGPCHLSSRPTMSNCWNPDSSCA